MGGVDGLFIHYSFWNEYFLMEITLRNLKIGLYSASKNLYDVLVSAL